MRLLLLFCVLLFAAGCSRTDVEKHPMMKRADDCRDEGNFQEAANGYKRLLEKYPDNPVLHLRLAALCDESLNRPDGAIFHYEEYLALTPANTPGREEIIAYRDAARKRLVETFKPDSDELDTLKQENQALRRRIEDLKKYLYTLQQRQKGTTPASVPASAAASSAAPPAAETPQPAVGSSSEDHVIYVVKAGDTPGKIAREFYGAASKYYLIMQANKLTTSRSLRIGQKLKIPKEIK